MSSSKQPFRPLGEFQPKGIGMMAALRRVSAPWSWCEHPSAASNLYHCARRICPDRGIALSSQCSVIRIATTAKRMIGFPLLVLVGTLSRGYAMGSPAQPRDCLLACPDSGIIVSTVVDSQIHTLARHALHGARSVIGMSAAALGVSDQEKTQVLSILVDKPAKTPDEETVALTLRSADEGDWQRVARVRPGVQETLQLPGHITEIRLSAVGTYLCEKNLKIDLPQSSPVLITMDLGGLLLLGFGPRIQDQGRALLIEITDDEGTFICSEKILDADTLGLGPFKGGFYVVSVFEEKCSTPDDEEPLTIYESEPSCRRLAKVVPGRETQVFLDEEPEPRPDGISVMGQVLVNGMGKPGVRVSLSRLTDHERSIVRTGRSGASGAFRVVLGQPGYYVMRMEVDGHILTTTTLIPEDTGSVWMPFSLEFCSLECSVRTLGGEPIAGAEVICVPGGGVEDGSLSPGVYSATTDESGVAVFDQLPAGEYVLKTGGPRVGYRVSDSAPWLYLVSTVLVLRDQAMNHELLHTDFVETPGRTGTAASSGGLEAGPGLVFCYPLTGMQSGWELVSGLASDGTYQWNALRSGHYLLLAVCRNTGLTGATELRIDDSPLPIPTIQLQMGRWLSVAIQDVDGNSVPFTVSLVDEYGIDHLVASSSRAWSTNHVVGPVSPGDYRIECHLASGDLLTKDWTCTTPDKRTTDRLVLRLEK